MKFVVIPLFVIGFVAMTTVLADERPGSDIATALQSLLDGLSTAVAKGDIGVVHETLQKGKNQLTELIPKVESQKSREVIKIVEIKLEELISKLSANKANMDDVRAFLNDAKVKLMQRLAEISN
ncbi:uncharacterized protein LOC129570725 [Sitodiplosis mosellana]|uniref:uncharacterized protein LOC129570725 n=1 Tax=Sitodiplosis mosellana TaxID=263140 RepID=UPI002444FDCA|nr:uncharacterized protein LOC129570725 [Sitodiplosis mosellana]